MPTFINTRPESRAEPLRSALQVLGHQVLDLPLLELSALPLEDDLIAQYHQLMAAQMVVVVSPIAAEIGLNYYRQLNLPLSDLQQKTWIAVGQATQKVLSKFNLQSIVPTVETSEGMLSLPELNHFTGECIAFWRGIGGRTFMMSQLAAQGLQIVNMLLYSRKMPSWVIQQAQGKLQQGDIVLISSEASWCNWLELLSFYDDYPENYQYIVLGDRVSQILQQAKQVYQTIYKLDVDEIHQCILQCKTL